ncbi:MAG: hypothetical protein HYR91_12860 [Flavobacteriia bacterium]|nr:hypothetical protein [Flavobacteriia bacterium]
MNKVRLFPKIEEVFINDFENYKRYFMPLVSIDLSFVNKSLDGQIHLVYYNNDPYCEEALTFSNEYCNAFKASFDHVDNKYCYKADFGIFKTNEDWGKWIVMGKKSYSENSELYKIENNLEISEVVKNLGMQPEWMQEQQWPLDNEGKMLIFICQVYSGDFVSDYCEEEIFLFYDKKNKMAVQIHQVR